MSDHTTTTLGIDEAELRRLAEAAQRFGTPWAAGKTCDGYAHLLVPGAPESTCGTRLYTYGDLTRYIAAANPAAILALLDELARVRQMHAGACDRIAAQAALLGRTAERDALKRLEAWEQEDSRRTFDIVRRRVQLCGYDPRERVYAHRCPSEAVDAGWILSSPLPRVVIVGTDEKPATTLEMIGAALDRWQELYGEKKGGA